MTKGLKFTVAAVGLGALGAAAMLPDAPEVEARTEASTPQGMIAIVDRENGGFRAATADEAARYAQPASGDRAASEVSRLTKRADGSESLRLDDRYMTYVTVKRNADGSWSEHCLMEHDHEAAHAANSQAADSRAVR